MEEFERNFLENKIEKLVITHREMNCIKFEFGEGCAIINIDNGTSQAGGYQCYQKYYGIFSYKRQKARKTTECKMG